MTVEKRDALYSGKAKTVYASDHPDRFILHFRDDATAFNGVKQATLTDKGRVNNYFNAHIMEHLGAAGIRTHFIERLSDSESLVKKLDMLPVECVVRNVAAGGIVKRLGLTEGEALNPPIFEFYYKDDELDDPMINRSHIETFGWASRAEMAEMEQLTFKVNEILLPLFTKAGFQLIDYKLEFGRDQGKLCLGDEFTPDGCRIWDIETREKFDKDRFRRDLGDVIAFYRQAAQRLGIEIPA